jgi:hypothetical protein
MPSLCAEALVATLIQPPVASFGPKQIYVLLEQERIASETINIKSKPASVHYCGIAMMPRRHKARPPASHCHGSAYRREFHSRPGVPDYEIGRPASPCPQHQGERERRPEIISLHANPPKFSQNVTGIAKLSVAAARACHLSAAWRPADADGQVRRNCLFFEGAQT